MLIIHILCLFYSGISVESEEIENQAKIRKFSCRSIYMTVISFPQVPCYYSLYIQLYQILFLCVYLLKQTWYKSAMISTPSSFILDSQMRKRTVYMNVYNINNSKVKVYKSEAISCLVQHKKTIIVFIDMYIMAL